MSRYFLVTWNPYPGHFWVQPKDYEQDDPQLIHYQTRRLASSQEHVARRRAAELNKAVAKLLGVPLEELNAPVDE